MGSRPVSINPGGKRTLKRTFHQKEVMSPLGEGTTFTWLEPPKTSRFRLWAR